MSLDKITSVKVPTLEMYVTKRNGQREEVSFDKVLNRIKAAAKGLDVNATIIAQKTLARIYNGVTTTELDELSARLAISLASTHPDYGSLASQIAVSNHQRNTSASFCDVMKLLSRQIHPRTGETFSTISPEFVGLLEDREAIIDAAIVHERDFLFDYFGFKTLEKQYLLKDSEGKVVERPQYMYMRVALALWGHLPTLDRAFETYELLSTKRFTHATPTLFNTGMPRQQCSSCYLLAMDSDTVTGIYKTLGDCAQISKYAGGIGLHIHNIRAKGSIIRGTNGVSNGIVPMLRVFNNTARYIDQGGGKRNGSFAIYLEPWHADIEDFLMLKRNTGAEEERARDLFYAMWVPDLFMERVEADAEWTLFCPAEAPGLADVWGPEFKELYERYEREGKGRATISAQKLWFKILDSQIETGTPYLVYKDAANAKSNQQNVGTIKSSNLCVAPETLILTDKGQIPISNLENKEINVWNGDNWSKTTVIKTGENQKLITVYLSNGSQITCTPYHKFIIRESYTDKTSIKDAKRVDASQLKSGDKLIKFDLDILPGDISNDIPFPYTHGFFCGDGTYHIQSNGNKTKGLSLYGDKKKLIPYLEIRSSTYEEDAIGRINTMLPHELPDKYFIPINSTIQCRLKWLAGLLDSDGCVARNGTNEALQISSIHFEFLDRLRLMLQTLGVQSKVTVMHEERTTLLPDGKGGRKEYECKKIWRILISSSAVHDLIELGLDCKRLEIVGDKPQRNAEQFVTVVNITDNGRTDDTYCFNEPINHAGVFNGILTGNCSEIIQYSDSTETAVCNLASINLATFIDPKKRQFNFDELRRVTAITIRNLNRVIDINYYPTPETEKSNMRHRPVGLGIQGLADVFAMMRMPWESEKAADLNQRIFEHMYYAAVQQSAKMAQEDGSYYSFTGSPASTGKLQPDLWLVQPLTEVDGSLDWGQLRQQAVQGLRNSLLLAPMPTASTSQICGSNECFEPFTSNIYTRRTIAGEFIVINKYLMNDLMKYQLWSEELKQKIIAMNGSIQDIEEIPKTIRELYKTSYEIKQRTLIDLAAARGAFICQSQSLNLFVLDATYSKLTSMHFYAWRKGLKTGIYYLRTKAPVMAQKFTVDPTLLSDILADKKQREEDQRKADEGCLMCSG